MFFMQACKALPGTLLSIGAQPGAGGGGTTTSALPPANGNIWLAGNPGSSLCWDAYNHFMPPNSTGCDNQADGNTGGWATLPDAFPPSSNHSGGVNIGFADGSVRFIKDTVAVQNWWAIGTRNGSEVISSDGF